MPAFNQPGSYVISNFPSPCFNPATPSERFDVKGQFIHRHVPELGNVNSKDIHAPWLMSADEQQRAGCVIGRDYPARVVEHAKAREVALALFKKDK